MAELKAGFATLNPSSGNGDSVITVTGENYKGRVLRTVTVDVATTDGSNITKQVVINQAPVPEFVEMQATASIGKEGGAVTISGTTNSTKLTFTINPDSENPIVVDLPTNFLANGQDTANGAVIANDPGATGDFPFSITLDIPLNDTVFDAKTSVTVTAAGGQTKTTLVTQNAGDARLEVDPEVINLNAAGDAQTFDVISNTDWSISMAVAKMKAKLFRK